MQPLLQIKNKEVRKEQIKKQVILPLLRLRLSSLDNFILPNKNKIKTQNNTKSAYKSFPELTINQDQMEKIYTDINSEKK